MEREVAIEAQSFNGSVAVGKGAEGVVASKMGKRIERALEVLDFVAAVHEHRECALGDLVGIRVPALSGSLANQHPAHCGQVVDQFGPFPKQVFAKRAHRLAIEAGIELGNPCIEPGPHLVLGAHDHGSHGPERVVEIEGQQTEFHASSCSSPFPFVRRARGCASS